MTEQPAPAPLRKRNRLRYTIVAVLCVGAVAWMLVLMQKNVVFFKTISQAVRDEPHDGMRTMRIGGGVLPLSIQQHTNGAEFDLTEGGVTVHVHHVGNEPDARSDQQPTRDAPIDPEAPDTRQQRRGQNDAEGDEARHANQRPRMPRQHHRPTRVSARGGQSAEVLVLGSIRRRHSRRFRSFRDG